MSDLRRAILKWDIVNWWRAVEFWEARIPADLTGFQALEIGASEGGLSLWLARRNAQVVCSDLHSPEPKAAPIHQAWGVSDRIRYEAIDATRIPYEGCFDIVTLKSVLGEIGIDQHPELVAATVQQILKALKPGGLLLFAENLDTPFHRYLRRLFVPWGRRWMYHTPEKLLGLLAGFEGIEHASTGFLGTLGRNHFQRSLLGRIDQLGVSWLVGKRNHYIMFGVARKAAQDA